MPADFALPWRPEKRSTPVLQTQALNAENASKFPWFQPGRRYFYHWLIGGEPRQCSTPGLVDKHLFLFIFIRPIGGRPALLACHRRARAQTCLNSEPGGNGQAHRRPVGRVAARGSLGRPGPAAAAL